MIITGGASVCDVSVVEGSVCGVSVAGGIINDSESSGEVAVSGVFTAPQEGRNVIIIASSKHVNLFLIIISIQLYILSYNIELYVDYYTLLYYNFHIAILYFLFGVCNKNFGYDRKKEDKP